MKNASTLALLRAANPVPVPSIAPDDTLFDAITSLPPDPRLARARRRYRVVVAVAVAAAVVAAFASAAPGISGWIEDVIGSSTANSDYSRAQNELALPPGYDWPASAYPRGVVTSAGAGGAAAVMIAQSAWECYWVRALDTHDAAGAARARAALADLMRNHVVVAPAGTSENASPAQAATTPTAVFADDGGYELKQRMYAEAAAGHPKLLRQSCRANAPPGWRR